MSTPSRRVAFQRLFRSFSSSKGVGTEGKAKHMSGAQKLRDLLENPGILITPCCHDGLSAVLAQRAGFDCVFVNGFGVAASYALPDAQIIGYREMLDAATKVVNVVDIPVFCDGDTGYGNAVNLKRTVQGYAKAGVACIMLEDQVSVKKRCGHTRGKEVVGFEESIMRIKAAVDAREESGCDILIMARTDARETHGFQHAVDRCQAFVELGADITFLEAPLSVEEMEAYCRHVPGSKMANMLENGKTPILPGDELEKMGFKIAAYPFAVLNASIVGMQKALQQLKEGKSPSNLSFQELQEIVGFDRYFEEEDRYSV